MGAKFSSGGGATVFYDKTDTPGEIVTELVNASDGAGLHLVDGGYVDLTNSAAAEYGTSDFSLEFVLNQTEQNSTGNYIYFSHTSGPDRFYVRHTGSDTVILTFRDASDSGTQYTINYGLDQNFGTPTHYVLTCNRDGDATLYANGNSVGTVDISGSSSVDIGATNSSVGRIGSTSTIGVLGTFYRFRTWNKLLSSAEVQTAYERADVPFADQYGSASNIVNGYNFSSWTTYNSSNVDATTQNITTGGGWWKKEYSLNAGFKHRIRIAGTQATTNFYLRTFALGGVTLSNIEETSGTLNSAGLIGGASFDVTAEITPTSNGFGFQGGAGTGEIEITTFEVHQIGCVSDYDLAYAQPALSTLIQDRSGAADGVASSSGVTQVQPITQLNSTSARIGSTQLAAGTAPYIPADGELLASGNIGSGSADPNINGWGNAITIDNSDAAALEFAKSGTLYGFVGVQGAPSSHALDIAAYQSQDMRFRVGSNAGTTAITIDSTGNVGINCDNPTVGQLQIDQSSGSTLALTRTAGATTGTLGLVRFGNTDVDSNLANILVYQDNATDAAAIAFQTQPTGGSTATRLTIDSTGLATFSNGVTVSGGFLSLDTPTELTIASGAVTVTRSFHDVDTEGDAATDDLDTINGGSAGDIVTLKTVTGSRDVTVKDGTGNLRLAGDFTLNSPNDSITLIKYSTVWIEMSRSDNV